MTTDEARACTHFCTVCGKTRFGGQWMHKDCGPCRSEHGMTTVDEARAALLADLDVKRWPHLVAVVDYHWPRIEAAIRAEAGGVDVFATMRDSIDLAHRRGDLTADGAVTLLSMVDLLEGDE